METICSVNFSLMNSKEARRVEAILREYLLRVSDQVHVTRVGSSSLSLFKLFPVGGFRFNRFVRMLEEKDIAYKSSHFWSLNLTENVKNLLNQATLLFSGSGRFFYGFTDPKFSLNGHEVAAVITNEGLITLYIPDLDKAQLANQGVYLDNVELI